MQNRCALFGVSLAWLCAAPVAARAAPGSGWFVSLGAFDPKASTHIRLDVLNGQYGTNLNLEKDLDLLQRRVVPQATFGYRFTARSSLEFNYLDLRRTGYRAIDENIHYGGVSYPINTTVSTFSDVRTRFLLYRYTLLDNGPWALSFSAGLHATRFTIGLADNNTRVSNSADADVPLPVVGLRGFYHLGDWQLRAEAMYFKMTVNRLSGDLTDYTLSLSHTLIDGVSLELGYTDYVLRLQAERTNLTGNMQFAYQGPFLNLCYGCLQPLQ